MSETSRSRVTITLGRTGQVVKRDSSLLDSSFTGSRPVVGSKRSVRERLGNGVDSSSQFSSKRLRRDGRIANAVDDTHLSRGDLRYKIMQKQSQSSQKSGVDLRDILSRPAQSSTNSIGTPTRARMPESKDTGVRYLEPMDRRQQLVETRDDRQYLPVTRISSEYAHEFRAQNIPNPRKPHTLGASEVGRSILEQKDVRYHLPESSHSRMTAGVLGVRPTNPVTRMESGVHSYSSPWTLDRLRRRSPDESLATSGGVSAPRRDEESQKRVAVRSSYDPRSSTYVTGDALEFSRPISSSHLTKTDPPVRQMKAVAPVVYSSPLPGSLAQRSSYAVDDQLTVDSFLRSLGLEKFAVLFKAEEVDMYALKRMAERDLKELGLPMGPRKKILLALQPRLRQAA